MTKQTMIKWYKHFNASDRYLVAFESDHELYYTEMASIPPRMIQVTRMSERLGGSPKLQMILNVQQKRQLVKKGAIKIDELPEITVNGDTNFGRRFEQYISEKNGIEYKGHDRIGFWADGDITINGIKYQLKCCVNSGGAQIAQERTLETLKLFEKKGIEPPETFSGNVRKKYGLE